MGKSEVVATPAFGTSGTKARSNRPRRQLQTHPPLLVPSTYFYSFEDGECWNYCDRSDVSWIALRGIFKIIIPILRGVFRVDTVVGEASLAYKVLAQPIPATEPGLLRKHLCLGYV